VSFIVELSSYDRSRFAAQRAEYLEAQGVDEQGLNGEGKEDDAD
jgi:hypothetical protein